MARAKPIATSTETEILRFIDSRGSASVAEVAEHIFQLNGQARTTVLTTMERLRNKGVLSRRKAQGVYRYVPKVPQETRLKGLVETFVQRSLAGNIAPFVAFLNEQPSISDEEFKELKRLVQELERKRKGEG